MARCISAVVLSQAWCPSPAISTTGVSPVTASSSETVTSRCQPPGRWPQPTTGTPGSVVIRSATSASTCSGDRAGARSSRCEASVHWVRWTCWSQRPGAHQRPSASYSSTPGRGSRWAATVVTRPSSTRTSTGCCGGAAVGPIGTRRARRISRLVTGATLGHDSRLVGQWPGWAVAGYSRLVVAPVRADRPRSPAIGEPGRRARRRTRRAAGAGPARAGAAGASGCRARPRARGAGTR